MNQLNEGFFHGQFDKYNLLEVMVPVKSESKAVHNSYIHGIQFAVKHALDTSVVIPQVLVVNTGTTSAVCTYINLLY